LRERNGSQGEGLGCLIDDGCIPPRGGAASVGKETYRTLEKRHKSYDHEIVLFDRWRGSYEGGNSKRWKKKKPLPEVRTSKGVFSAKAVREGVGTAKACLKRGTTRKEGRAKNEIVQKDYVW